MELFRRIPLLAATAICAALALAACGGSDDDEPAADGQARSEQGAGSGAGEGRSGAEGGGSSAGGKSAGGKSADGRSAGGNSAGAQGTAGAGGVSLSGDREQAREASQTARGVYRDFGAAVEEGISAPDVAVTETLDAAQGNDSLTRICDLMSEEARKQTVTYARRSAGLADVDWTCEKATGLLLRRADQTGGLKRTLRAEVVGVNAEGDRATATVRFGGKGPLSTIALVREDGEWKLAAAPAGGGG